MSWTSIYKMKDLLKGLYLITDESLIDQSNYFSLIEDLLSNHIDILQLRIKDASEDEVLYKAKELRKITSKYKTLFIINDNLNVALQSQADGLHIGKNDQSFNECRKALGEEKVIGVSCYGDSSRVKKFKNLGADYVAIGTPYFTKTKPDREPTPFSLMQSIISEHPGYPIFAIGGIEISNAREVLSTGVTGIAVINGILSYQNSSDRVNKFNEILENFS